jgi:CBS domain-containing protein
MAEAQVQASSDKNTRFDVKLYRKLSQPETQTKKQSLVKEISKMLHDIEESNKEKKLIYFSHLFKKRIFDSGGKYVGKLKDLAILGGDRFPDVSHLLVSGKEEFITSWQNVADFNGRIKLNKQLEQIDKRPANNEDILLNGQILDQQVVDVNGLKVIRVNDIALTYIKGKLSVVNIDIGTKAIFRRLGFERLANWLPFEVKDHPVPWDSVEPLSAGIEKIHLKVPCPRVSDLHPADVADLFDELSLIERTTILKNMKSETAAKVLLECDHNVQKSIMKSLKPKRIAAILDKMPANDAANLISGYGNSQLDTLLKLMDLNAASKVQEMLSFKEGCAARHMDSIFVSVKKDATVQQTIEVIRNKGKLPDNLYYVYIVDDNDSLIGVVSLKHILMSDPETSVFKIMTTKLITIDISDPIQYVEEIMTKFDLMAIPAVDVNGRIKGVINAEDVLNFVISHTKKHKPIELTSEQKSDLKKERRLKAYTSRMIKDVGQFLKEIEPKKSDYIVKKDQGTH